MGSKTVALQDSTYERLKAARRPGESFTEAVDRLLEGKEPSLLDFVGLIPKKDADELAKVIEQMRAEDARVEKLRWNPPTRTNRGRKRGRNL